MNAGECVENIQTNLERIQKDLFTVKAGLIESWWIPVESQRPPEGAEDLLVVVESGTGIRIVDTGAGYNANEDRWEGDEGELFIDRYMLNDSKARITHWMRKPGLPK